MSLPLFPYYLRWRDEGLGRRRTETTEASEQGGELQFHNFREIHQLLQLHPEPLHQVVRLLLLLPLGRGLGLGKGGR
jgi:hypothetical protein